jgi:hypothetical protein
MPGENPVDSRLTPMGCLPQPILFCIHLAAGQRFIATWRNPPL